MWQEECIVVINTHGLGLNTLKLSDTCTPISPLVAVLCGENLVIISIVPAGDDVGDGQSSNGDEPDAGRDLDDAAETDGEQGEDRRDDKPPARAMDHDALENICIAHCTLNCY